MHQNNSFLLTLTLILATLAWGEVVTAQPIRNMIVEVKGKVELKRQGASRFIPASRYTELRLGDLIKPAPGASAKVLCEDGKTRIVQAGVTSGLNGICPSPKPRKPFIETVEPRAGELTIPYIISPRATLLLSDKPVLRWNGATGSNNFTVTVRGEGLNWTKQVNRSEVCQENTCELVYSGSPLQRDVSYKLVVETETNRSSAEDTTGWLGFKLIDAAEAIEVRTIAQQIGQQELSAQVKGIALADLYAEYNLLAEAIATLEELAKNQKIAAAYRRLGDLYLRIGLAREAEVQYLEAVKLAPATEEIEEQAAAKSGLSQVSLALNRQDEAVRLLEEAVVGYEQLEDTQRVNALKEELRRLTDGEV
jgi:hypothetical protein